MIFENVTFRDVALLKRRLKDEATNLKSRVDKRAIKVGKCTETYIEFFLLNHEYDAFLVAPDPPNPWITDSTELWDMYAECAREQVAERRVRRWSISCRDMLKDPIGHDHFKAYLEKEYATENLLFVEAVWKMKKLAAKGNNIGLLSSCLCLVCFVRKFLFGANEYHSVLGQSNAKHTFEIGLF